MTEWNERAEGTAASARGFGGETPERAAGSEDDISLILINRPIPPQATGWRRWWPRST